MTIKLSTAARNFLAAGGSYKDLFQNGRMEIYSGSQPASADAAVTGTLLCTITDNSAARTAEVLASGSVTLTGGASGSLNTLTVNSVDILGGAVPYNTSLTQTAADIALQINRNKSNVEYTAAARWSRSRRFPVPGRARMGSWWLRPRRLSPRPTATWPAA